MNKFKDESEVDAFITKIAVDCGLLGVEAATKGFRSWLEAKGMFDSGAIPRWEFEFAVSIIEKEFVERVSGTLSEMLKGDDSKDEKERIE